MRRLKKFRIIALLCSTLCSMTSASSAATSKTIPRRERYLDHLNVETLAYYLGVDPTSFKQLEEGTTKNAVDHDTAVMFYVQWDQNSHTLAPYWDKIAEVLVAGSKKSNLIMGLFNCELDLKSMELCEALNIKYYPSMIFMGHGPFRDAPLIGGSKSRSVTPYPNAVKFLGNWQYTDSVLDWIKAMQALSGYNKGNLLRKIRNMLFFKNSAPTTGKLPVGLPSGGGNAAVPSSALLQLQKKVYELGNETEKLEKMATHASLLLDAIMFPPSPDQDAFRKLAEIGPDAWDEEKTKDDPLTTILRNCVAELALDYCTRLSTHVTTEYLDEAMGSNSTSYPSFLEIEADLKRRVDEKEPYCSIFDECLANNFANETCRPSTCPFNSTAACDYLHSCFDETIQTEYAVALELIAEGETFDPSKVVKPATSAEQAETKKEETGEAPPKKRGAWGFGS